MGIDGNWAALTHAVIIDYDQIVAIPAPSLDFGALELDVVFRGEGETRLDFSDRIGTPPVATVAVVASDLFPVAETRRYVPGQRHGVSIALQPITQREFVRGDANADSHLDVADAVFFITYLFRDGIAPSCLEGGNVNGDTSLDLGDPIYLLNYIFRDGLPPPAPFPSCGPDPDPATSLGCNSYPPCAGP